MIEYHELTVAEQLVHEHAALRRIEGEYKAIEVSDAPSKAEALAALEAQHKERLASIKKLEQADVD